MSTVAGRIGTFLRLAWLANAATRRRRLAILAAVFAVLSVLPQPYKATAALNQVDQSADKLSPSLGGYGTAFSAFMGATQLSEFHLRVGRSVDVRRDVMRRMDVKPLCWGLSKESLQMWCLDQEIAVRMARGGILLVEAKGHDAKLMQKLVTTYVAAIEDRLKVLGEQQTEIKRRVIIDRLEDSRDRLKVAEEKLDAFRRANDIPDPSSALGVASNRLPALKDRLRALQMKLSVLKEFQTDESFGVRSLEAEMAEVRRQIGAAEKADPEAAASVDGLVAKTTEYAGLLREVRYSRGLFEWFQRLAESTALEDLVSKTLLREVEEPHIDTDLQFNYGALLLLVLTLCAFGAFELKLIDPSRLMSSRD